MLLFFEAVIILGFNEVPFIKTRRPFLENFTEKFFQGTFTRKQKQINYKAI